MTQSVRCGNARVMISMCLLLLSSGIVAQAPCRPATNVGVVATASPDLGIVTPHKLVKVGTRVTLHGICSRFVTNSQCKVSTSQLLFTWSMRFYPDGAAPSDATPLLINPSSLNPSFTPNATGKYLVTLACNSPGLFAYKARIFIEVIRQGETWVDIGASGLEPSGGGGYPFTGRANALFLRKGVSNFFVGAAGGLWKYDNPGDVWYPLVERKGLPTLAVSSIEMSANGTLFIGTGDVFPGTKIFDGGKGIYRSTDNGTTWVPIGQTTAGCPAGTTAFSGLARKIISDPNNVGTIFIGTDQGVFRSTNNGDCWTRLTSTPVTDMLIDPSNSADLLCAAPLIGVLRVANAAGVTPTVSTLKSFPAGGTWSVIKVAPSNPLILYVILSSGVTTATMFKSVDGGASWPASSTTTLSCSQCSYNIALAVDPSDPNHLAYGQVVLQQSTDGGTSFSALPGDPGGHSDIHDLSFDPNDASTLYAATDGGVQRIRFDTKPNYNPLGNWEDFNNGLSCSQVEGYAAAPGDPAACATGLWDNGTQYRNAGRLWQRIKDGDGFNVAIDALNPKTIFFNSNALNGGDTWRWSDNLDVGTMVNHLANPFKWGELFAIILQSKSDNKLYVAENSYSTPINPWACSDPLPGDKSAIFSLEFAADKSYFASYSTGSIIHFNLDESKLNFTTCGTNQTAATNVETVFSPSAASSPTMSSDPFNANSLYVCLRITGGGFQVVVFTKSNGAWASQDITGDLPTTLAPTGAIQADPFLRGRVFIGGNQGLWSGSPDGAGNYHWVKDPDIPEIRVNNIVSHRDFAKSTPNIRIGTFGRGVWERIPVVFFNRCLTCITDVILYPLPPGAQTSDSASPNKDAWISVNYKSDNKKELLITAHPLVKANHSRDFFSDTLRVRENEGEGSGLLHIWFANQKASRGITTDSVVVEMRTLDRRILFTKHFAMHQSWLKPDESVLHVSSIGGGPGSWEQYVKLRVTTKSGKPEIVHTPFDMVVPTGATVELVAPSYLGSSKDRLSGWRAGNKMIGSKERITVTMKKSQSIVVSYRHEKNDD